MAQVIIYTNTNGGISVCVPTGELPIQQVLTKDCPEGAIIVDDSALPQGTDAQFFDAWTLSGSTVSVDQTKAKAQATSQLNKLAYAEAQHRAAKVGAGLTNVMADSDWATLLTTARTAITNAAATPAVAAVEANPNATPPVAAVAAVPAVSYTQALVNAIAPVQAAITANAL